VRERGGKSDVRIPLHEWVRLQARCAKVMLLYTAMSNFELEPGLDCGPCIERLELLMALLDELQHSRDCCGTIRRFLRPPTVGSFHQLRAELQLRYAGRQYWVNGPCGRKIDAMFLSWHDREPSMSFDPTNKLSEEQAFLGPTIIWCNPNAGYYESLVVESHWLNFYLSCGCNVFVFNYSGFGRSTGNPSPSSLAADGDAIIHFLMERGVTQIGVHGRSIGGIAGCHLAKKYPELIKILIADRTFSTLARVANFMFGGWAVQGLSLSGTWAENIKNFTMAPCYKVMICDPKDMSIPDVASLRTAVALKAVDDTAKEETLVFEDDRLRRIGKSLAFFDNLTMVFEDSRPADASQEKERYGKQGNSKSGVPLAVPVREPIITQPVDVPTDLEEADTARLMSRPRTDLSTMTVDITWLQDHTAVVQSLLDEHISAMRAVLDIVTVRLNAGGMTLEDALGRASKDHPFAIRCFVANLQVWGSLPTEQELLQPAFTSCGRMYLVRNCKAGAGPPRNVSDLSPEQRLVYHRLLASAFVSRAREDFNTQLTRVLHGLEGSALEESSPRAMLYSAVCSHLRVIEGFLSALDNFFKRVDTHSSSGPSAMTIGAMETERGDPEIRTPRPIFNRSLTGYVMCVDCGHNGQLRDVELKQLRVHLRAAEFGRHGENVDMTQSISL